MKFMYLSGSCGPQCGVTRPVVSWFCIFCLLKFNDGQLITPENYDKTFPPDFKAVTNPIGVNISMKINGIHHIDPITMSFRLQLYVRVMWIDNRLVFPDEYFSPQQDVISLNSKVLKDLWTPDIYFLNLLDIVKFNFLQDAQGVKFSRSKQVYTSTMHDIKLACPMIFTDFPFDTQTCKIQLSSYAYNADELQIGWHRLRLAIDSIVPQQMNDYEFQVIASNTTVCGCSTCIAKVFPCIDIKLILQRKYLVHVLSYYIPSFLFTMVSWASFFWPPKVIPGRTVLVITSLLTGSSLYAASRDNVPKTSYVKAVDAWMFFAIIIAVLNLLQYGIVLQIMHLRNNACRSDETKKEGSGKESVEARYDRYQRNTELVGRIGEPIIVVIFNFIYWLYFF